MQSIDRMQRLWRLDLYLTFLVLQFRAHGQIDFLFNPDVESSAAQSTSIKVSFSHPPIRIPGIQINRFFQECSRNCLSLSSVDVLFCKSPCLTLEHSFPVGKIVRRTSVPWVEDMRAVLCQKRAVGAGGCRELDHRECEHLFWHLLPGGFKVDLGAFSNGTDSSPTICSIFTPGRLIPRTVLGYSHRQTADWAIQGMVAAAIYQKNHFNSR